MPLLVNNNLSRYCQKHAVSIGRELFSVIAGTAVVAAAPALAQSTADPQMNGSLGTSQDCTQIEVQYADDPTLTDAEKVALMDRALFQSLSRYDGCKNASFKSGGGGGGGSAAGGGDTGAGNGSGNGGGAGSTGGMRGTESTSNSIGSKSIASSDMTGTIKPAESAEENGASRQAGMDAIGDMTALEGNADEDGTWQEGGVTADNGKIPEDIPPADNDSVLEAQIRQAAINETDPEVKAKLWDEYRRYKGLPSKN